MPWCLSCSTETSKQKHNCPGCGEALAKGPGISTAVEYLDRNWFAIRSISNPEEAETLREFLESKNIDVAIRNGQSKARGTIKMNSGMGSEMLVLVPADTASRAADMVRNNDWKRSSSIEDLVQSVYPDEDEFSEEIDLLDDESEYLDAAVAVDTCDDYDEM